MKSYLFLFLGITSAITAPAQTQKGQSITSGNVGVAYTHGTVTGFGTSQLFSANNYNTSVSIALNRGVFVRDNWLVGYTVGFGQTWQGAASQYNQQDQTQGVIRATTGSLGGFVRRYWPVADRLFVYGGGGLGVSYGRNKGEQQSVVSAGQPVTGTSLQENWSVDPSVQAGLLYAVSNRFGIEAGIRSNGLPVGASTASIGINILSGRGGGTQDETITASQTQAGRWLLGASFNASGNSIQQNIANSSDTRYTSGNIGLSAGRFVRDNIVIGLALNATTTATTNNFPMTTTSATTYTIAPFVRVYKGQTRLRPFVEGSVNFSDAIQSANRNLDQQQLGAQASAGVAYMLGQRFIVQSTLATLYGRYQWYPKQPNDLKYTNYTVGLTGSIGSNLSIAYSF